jgi:inner membrane transporter RhtA
MGTSGSSRELFYPWTNNGINVLGIVALLAGAFFRRFIICFREESFNEETERLLQQECYLHLNDCPFGIMGSRLNNLTPTFLSLGVALALLSGTFLYIREMKALGQLPARTFNEFRTCRNICALTYILQEYLALNEVVAVICRNRIGWINLDC